MKRSIFLIISVLACISLNAQINISNVSLPISGDTARYSVAKMSSVGNFTATGTSYTWHFDTLRPVTQGVRTFTNNTPYAMFFNPISKFGEKIADTLINQTVPVVGHIALTTYYQFYRNLPTVFDIEGAGMKINGIPVPSFYSDKDELYFLPLHYGQRDSSTFKFSTPTTTAVPIVYKKQGYRITEVDGWGSVTTPYGTFNCLRLITTQYSKDTIVVNTGSLTIPIGFINNQRSYQWLTTTEKIPVLEISGSYNGNNFAPNRVRYRDNYRVVSVQQFDVNNTVKVYPNPTSGLLNIDNVFNDNIQIQIVSVNGQTIFSQNEHTGFQDKFQMDLSHLPNGYYFGIITKGKEEYRFNFLIQK